MTQSRFIILAGILLSSTLPNLAVAQSSCDCSTGISATVTSISGDVTTSGAFGFAAGELGQVLSAGSEIYTGAGSTANISFGPNCNFQIRSQSKAVFVAKPGSSAICAEISQIGVSEASTAQAPLTGWVFAAGAVGLTAWGVSALSDEEDYETPTSP